MHKSWHEYVTWQDAEAAWDDCSQAASQRLPLKRLTTLPSTPNITKETARHLRWKSFKYMVSHDCRGILRKNFLKLPLRYSVRFVKSVLKGKAYSRDGDFFLYGVDSVEEFKERLRDPESIFILGFSYCHKPFECPAERFSSKCCADSNHDACCQCFIGKCMHLLSSANTIRVVVPTVHDIGAKVFEVMNANPGRRVFFLITACELSLEMFGDWGNMAGIKGIGVRLGGRVCNTMKAFELSEKGIKPGLTVVAGDTQRRILDILKWRYDQFLVAKNSVNL